MSVQGVSSSLYESWITNLKAVQGTIRKRIFGAFARALGDKTVEWMTQVNLEHMPSFASDQSIALIASERQLDTAPSEATSAIAARAPFWLQLAQFSGSGLGILLGLHFTGFDGAYLVQQNGLALTLTLPLPAFTLGTKWDPTPNLVVTNCSQLTGVLTSNVTPPTWMTPGRSIPASQPWWKFDDNTDFCSRFAVVFTANQYPSLSAADQTRMRNTISKWRPAKATCVGIYSLSSGQMWQTLPTAATWGHAGNWGGSVVSYAGV